MNKLKQDIFTKLDIFLISEIYVYEIDVDYISVDLNTLRARIAAQAQEAARRARNSNPIDSDTWVSRRTV